MKAAPWITVDAPLEARARYLAHAYADILADGKRLRDRLAPLRYHRGAALVAHWSDLIAAGDRVALCRSLAADHYDPAYAKAMRAQAPTVLAHHETPALDPEGLDNLADAVARTIQTRAP
jgi:hypothetical protein